jgi:ferredoxin
MAGHMPPEARVRCLPSGRTLAPQADQTVLDAALAGHQPLASSCGGRAVCGDCVVLIVRGAQHAAPVGADESAWRARTGYEGPGRLACCLVVHGDIDVTTTYW